MHLAAKLVFQDGRGSALGLWLRFTVVLLALSVIGLVEGVLLSPFGFGWFLLALAITFYVVKKFARRLLGWSDINGAGNKTYERCDSQVKSVQRA